MARGERRRYAKRDKSKHGAKRFYGCGAYCLTCNPLNKYVRIDKMTKRNADRDAEKSVDKNEKKFEVDQAYRNRENEVLLSAYYRDE